MQIYTNPRQSQIVDLIRLHGTCSIPSLADQLGVSEETIRRDVKPLVENGLATKVHGGVMMPKQAQEPPFQRRLLVNKLAKQQLASVVARVIPNGSSVLLDAGTTNVYVAQALISHRQLRVITNSPEVALTLATRNDNRVHLAGGELHPESGAALGPEAHNYIRQFQVDYALISISGIKDGSFLDVHPVEAEFSKLAMACADQTIIVADHSKCERDGFVKVCEFTQVDMLVMDQLPAMDIKRKLAAAGVEIITPES